MRTRSSPSTPERPTAAGRWTALALIRTTARFLEERGVPEARLSAEHLLAHVLSCRRLDLYLSFDRPVSGDELERYRSAVRRRAAHEPVAYITGRAAFRDLDLTVDSRVLVPRPETERLVDEVLRWCREEAGAGRAPAGGWRVIDRGTGSGAIACAIASELEGTRWVLGIDDSVDAVALASWNARRLGIERVRWVVADGLMAVAACSLADAVVANPPYLAHSDRSQLERQVVEWEPERALFAGPRGVEGIEAVIAESAAVLRPGGLLAIEIGDGQLEPARVAVEAASGLCFVGSYHDLAGSVRGILAVRQV